MTHSMAATMEEQTVVSEVQVTVTDPELVGELSARRPGVERDGFAEGALRIGVIALRHAGTRIDAETVRQESDRLVALLRDTFLHQQDSLVRGLSTTMREYLDPKDGRFSERVERLVGRDGDLERVLRQQIGNEGSELARTLAHHVGEGSPLLKLLDPERKSGFLGELSGRLEDELGRQRDAILRQFSLDVPESALSRLVGELETRQGKLGEDLGLRVEELVEELSLDNSDSALSRLVRQVEAAQRTISAELSLDDASSALARIRRELLAVLDDQRQKDEAFRLQVVEQRVLPASVRDLIGAAS